MNQRIRCFVCQRDLDGDSANYHIFYEDKAWRNAWKMSFDNLLINAKDLESKYFDFDEDYYYVAHWRFLLRLISYDYHENKLLISGIGHFDTWDQTIAVPIDPNKALIGWGEARYKQGITGFHNANQLGWWWHKSSRKSSKAADWRQLPLAIHMSCWKLVQWQLGPSVEVNLELFAAIMLKISVENPSKLKCQTYDAYRITSVQRLIQASKRKFRQKKTRKEGHSGLSRFHYLPMELLDMILDHLPCKKIQELETELGISVAENYWRRRAASFLAEMDEIANKNLDWRYLCTEWERISNDKLFRDYHYIVGILRDQVKPTYMKNLKKRTFPVLEKVIAEL